jgi:hypothetical protein
MWIGLKSDPELYEWLDDIYAKCPLLGVSGPTNFVHQGGSFPFSILQGTVWLIGSHSLSVHVGFDAVSGAFTVS